MSQNESHHLNESHRLSADLHALSPTDMFRKVIAPPAGQDIDARLKIITVMHSLMARQPSPDLVAFVKNQLQTVTDPQVRAFMQLIIAEDPRYRQLAEEGLKLLEQRLQEEEVQRHAVDNPCLTIDPMHGRGGVDDMLAAFKGAAAPIPATPLPETAGWSSSATVVPFPTPHTPPTPVSLPWHSPQADIESIAIPIGADPHGPKNLYSYINPSLAVDRPITTVAGLVIAIAGQPQVEHGFGFYLPLPSGLIKIDYTGQHRNVIKIAMSLPETIVLYDEHQALRLGGISNFFTIYEAMRDGYRFLLDLEIIPVNGRYALSLQNAVHIDRRDPQGQPAFVSSAHLNKLAHACSAISFHAFTGEFDYHD